MQKLEGTSMDIVKDNIEKLKEIFPEVCTEGKIDFEILRQLLGEDIENDKEKFYFSWNGKTRAAQISKNQSTGTLRPIKENPKVWDNTENIYIEGENLEVLKLLQKSYYRKIKMIYIDPPYNTGKQFVYPDNYKNSLKDYLEMTGQIGKEGYKLSTNLETNGRFHSDWLSMMYSRLIIARKLLTDDGVILISIDDRELKNLLALVNDYFGEKNIDILIWQKTDPQVDRNTNSKQIARFLEFKEYIVVVYKNKAETVFNKIKRKPEWKNAQKNADNDPRGNWQSGIFSYEEGHENEDVNSESYFEITTPNGTKYKRHWFCENYEKYKELEKEKFLYFGKDGGNAPRIKVFENLEKEFYLTSILKGFGTSGTAKDELLELLGSREIFDTPKPTKLLMELIRATTDKDSYVLDFFSGSSTTAQAVMQLNADDGGNRKFIMVQFPEPCEENICKLGYKTICDIGKARIQKSAEKIKLDGNFKLENRNKLDTGFKMFKLDSSNIKEWDSETDNLKQMLLDSVDNIKSDRTSLDVLYEVLLKYGLDLNIPIEEKTNFYSIGGGTLLINLEKEIDMNIIDSMCEEYRSLLEIDEDFKTTVILRDSAFKNDVDKTNAIKKLEQTGIKEIRSI